MDVSVHSLEVINRVASKLTLPREYIQRCISNSMKSCQNSPDKGMQPRLVRLVCVAIQAWVRNKIIDITGTVSLMLLIIVALLLMSKPYNRFVLCLEHYGGDSVLLPRIQQSS